ncbi:MAG TPA: GGDEF domain-containing protein [Acidobacteriaceae bacterium]|jgi:diguanylate cyclase (GGDEF)-like protein|nr:GGDEF domain-containing protein [Acidobacteriaceae bacterium]
MYTPFLMCGYAAALLLMLVGFRGVRRSTPDLHGSRQLVGFILCALAAILLFGLRPWAPTLVSLVVPNFLLFVGGLYVYLAAADVQQQPPRLFPWPGLAIFLGLPAFLWFTYVHDEALGRLLVHASVMAAIFLTTAVRLFREKDATIRPAARACAWLLIVSTLLQVGWFVSDYHAGPLVGVNFIHPDLVNVGFSYLSMILALATVIALLWLALTVHRLDLSKMAQTDALTGLLNRRAFEEILRRELLRCERSGGLMGLMLIDLDYFKQVNDSLGHFAGDDALRRIAIAIREGTRPSDVLARYGGEEFVVLLRNAALEESRVAAERIRQTIATMVGLPGSVTLTASIGVAVSEPRDTTTDFLLRSDEALYRSKREGRDRVSVYRASDRGGTALNSEARRRVVSEAEPAK